MSTIRSLSFFSLYELHLFSNTLWLNLPVIFAVPTGYRSLRQLEGPTTTQSDPQANYTQTTYGDVVVAYSAAGVGHTVPVHETIDLVWFGITAGTVIPGDPTTPTDTPTPTGPATTPVTSAPSTTVTAPAATQTEWGQCGGYVARQSPFL